jgi:hypothetical protein
MNLADVSMLLSDLTDERTDDARHVPIVEGFVPVASSGEADPAVRANVRRCAEIATSYRLRELLRPQGVVGEEEDRRCHLRGSGSA